MQSGVADLQTAYETVIGELGLTQPEVQKTEKAEQETRVPIKQKKKAASGVKSTGTQVQRTEPQSMREELASNLQKMFPDGKVKF